MGLKKILVVEDENLVAQDIRYRLEQMGYPSPEIALTGEEAIEKASTVSPDLILMDVILSRGYVDGVDAAEKIRTFLDVPIIYLTASSDAATLDRAKLTAPDGYILKPFQTKELQIAIELTLYKYEVDREILRKDRQLLETLKDMEEGVVAADEFGKVFYMNPAAERLTGWISTDALGQPSSEIVKLTVSNPFREEDPDGLLGFYDEDGGLLHGNLESRIGPNTEVLVVRKSIIPPNQGESIGSVLILRSSEVRK